MVCGRRHSIVGGRAATSQCKRFHEVRRRRRRRRCAGREEDSRDDDGPIAEVDTTEESESDQQLPSASASTGHNEDAGDEGALNEEKALPLQENEAEAHKRKSQDVAKVLRLTKTNTEARSGSAANAHGQPQRPAEQSERRRNMHRAYAAMEKRRKMQGQQRSQQEQQRKLENQKKNKLIQQESTAAS